MNKLTAEIALRNINLLKDMQSAPNIGLSIRSEIFLQALEIALPILEQRERGEWIEWGGGECPVDDIQPVEVRLRDGFINRKSLAGELDWEAGFTESWAKHDIIAYRIIDTNQNGEQ